MPAYKFKNLLSDPQAYDAAEQYWYGMFEKLLSSHAKQSQWHKWFDNRYVDGTPMRHGNPICSMVSYEARRGVRIIQDEPGSFSPEIAAWVDTFDDAKNEAGIEELVITCILSEEIEKTTYKLIYAFVIDNISKHDMEQLIEKLVPLRCNIP